MTVTAKDAAAAKAGVDKRVAEYFEFLKKTALKKKILTRQMCELSLNMITVV